MIGLFDYDLYKKREKYFLPNIYLMKCYNYYSSFTKVEMLYSKENWGKYQIVFVFSENKYLNKQDLPNISNIKFVGSGYYDHDAIANDFVNSKPKWEPYGKWLKVALEYDFLTPYEVRKYTDASHILFSYEKNNIIFETEWEKNFYENKDFVVIYDRKFFNLTDRSFYFSESAKYGRKIYFYHNQDIRDIKKEDIELIRKYNVDLKIKITTEIDVIEYMEIIKQLNSETNVMFILEEHELSKYTSEKMWEERIYNLIRTSWFLSNNNIKFEYELPFDYEISPFQIIHKIIRIWNYEKIKNKTFSVIEGVAHYSGHKNKNPMKKFFANANRSEKSKYYSGLLGLLINYPKIFFPYIIKKPMYHIKEGISLTGLERKEKIEELDNKLREEILNSADKGVLNESLTKYSKELQEYINGCDHKFSENESAIDSNGVCSICKKHVDLL